MGRYFGVIAANVDAVATAEASPANAMTCVKPFTIPDRWIEKQDPGGWNSETSTFDTADNHGKPLANRDVYIPADQPGYTGYNRERDKGTELMIRAGTGNNIQPELLLLVRHGRRDRRLGIRVEHRQLQHDHDGLGRSAAAWSPATWSARPTQGIDELLCARIRTPTGTIDATRS